MTYQIVDGYDNAGTLADVDPQPKSGGLMYPERIAALDGTEFDDGLLYTDWVYTMLTAAQYDSLLTAFGLASAITNEVTVKTITDDRTFANYNGMVVKPRMGKDVKYNRGFYHDARFRIKHMEAL